MLLRGFNTLCNVLGTLQGHTRKNCEYAQESSEKGLMAHGWVCGSRNRRLRQSWRLHQRQAPHPHSEALRKGYQKYWFKAFKKNLYLIINWAQNLIIKHFIPSTMKSTNSTKLMQETHRQNKHRQQQEKATKTILGRGYSDMSSCRIIYHRKCLIFNKRMTRSSKPQSIFPT